MAVAGASNSVLKRSKSGHPRLVPELSGKAFSFVSASPLFSLELSSYISFSVSFSLSSFAHCFFFLGAYLQHMEVPSLGVKLELQLPAYATAMPDSSCICDLHHSSWQRWILNTLSKARDHTCSLMDPSQFRFHCATMGTPLVHFFLCLISFSWHQV